MLEQRHIHIALLGNPNCGKSSLFNALTGLNQKVGNFPGVTVDKKTGMTEIPGGFKATVIDLPGTYSLYPRRADEWVSYNVLMNPGSELKPDIVVLIVDASNLKRNLLFATQIIDLKLPVVIALTMMDIARKKGTTIDVPGLERELGVPIVAINPRKEKGIQQLKKVIEQTALHLYKAPAWDFIDTHSLAGGSISAVRDIFPEISEYKAIHYLINHEHFPIDAVRQDRIETIEKENGFNHTRVQADEIMQRYARIRNIMQQTVVETDPRERELFTERLDRILLHRVWGYAILVVVLFLLFQSIFWVAQYPMDAIDWAFGRMGSLATGALPDNRFTDLLINGVLAGLSGILVFVPQIMILFGLITVLEDTGYMARISFLTDKVMRKVGLNGKSVMPMISGFACAVPAIMSARSIENRKERLLTIMITPLMSCSARLPVYTILIALVVPNTFYAGFLSLQGLVMMGLYLLGFVMALVVAYVMKFFIRIREKSFFILELPVYRSPRWKNVGFTMVEKARIFLFDAGKVIMIISLILWALSSFGPGDRMGQIRDKYAALATREPEAQAELSRQRQTELLESSYAGYIGKAIEPLVTPLGFDWKIGIALVTSFAAREVFVGTMATLYSVGDDSGEDDKTLRQKMQSATRVDGTKVYTLATAVSLMIFYVFAMQCMSTLAVVRRETKSWRWPALQLVYMTALAYGMSLLAYNLLK